MANLVLAVGEFKVINPTVESQNGQPISNQKFGFSSSAPAVASVDDQGRVKGLTVGGANISVTCAGAAPVVQAVIVEDPVPTTITLDFFPSGPSGKSTGVSTKAGL